MTAIGRQRAALLCVVARRSSFLARRLAWTDAKAFDAHETASHTLEFRKITAQGGKAGGPISTISVCTRRCDAGVGAGAPANDCGASPPPLVGQAGEGTIAALLRNN